jgi:hypothetical protein
MAVIVACGSTPVPSTDESALLGQNWSSVRAPVLLQEDSFHGWAAVGRFSRLCALGSPGTDVAAAIAGGGRSLR